MDLNRQPRSRIRSLTKPCPPSRTLRRESWRIFLHIYQDYNDEDYTLVHVVGEFGVQQRLETVPSAIFTALINYGLFHSGHDTTLSGMKVAVCVLALTTS